MSVKNKVAIVTGASSGIGLAAARLLTQEGARVALVARSARILKDVSKELKDSLPVPADMTDGKAVKRMVETVHRHYGQIDILANIAGRGYDCPVESIDPEKFRDIIELNLVGPLVAMQAVIPHMRRQGGGSIVNISSGTAFMHVAGFGAYSSTKRALIGLSLTARDELMKDKIAVSVVYPYITQTNFEKNEIKCDPAHPRVFSSDLPPFDTPELVAESIVEVINTGEPEQYVHAWMREQR